jgi:MSHA pilin protein MshA
MVIVILGILAATALPKFFDLSTDAKKAAIAGVAGAVSSAGSINYAIRSINAASGVAITAAGGCAAIVGQLQGGALPNGYSITGTAPNCSVDTTTPTAATAAYVPLIN